MTIDPANPDTASPAVAPTTLADVVNFARSLSGLSANPATGTRERYLATIAPGETDARAAQMALMSGCELVMLRGVLGHFIRHPLLEQPYRDRKAGEDLLQVAREAGAILTHPAAIAPGHIVIVGGGPEYGGAEHAWLALDLFDRTGLDGGHVVDGYQAIITRPHSVVAGWDSTATYRRRVRWVLDGMAIVRAFG